MSRNILETVLAILIPLAGAMGYVHGTFATKASVKTNTERISRMDSLICKMAIRQNIKNAESICTE